MPTRFVSLILIMTSSSPLVTATEKTKVFITESQAVQLTGEQSSADAKGSLALVGGTSPQSLEVIKAFSKSCPNTIVTSNRDKADYVVRLDHEALSPTTPFVHGNKVAVFDKNEELIYSDSTRFLARAVRGACNAIAATR